VVRWIGLAHRKRLTQGGIRGQSLSVGLLNEPAHETDDGSFSVDSSETVSERRVCGVDLLHFVCLLQEFNLSVNHPFSSVTWSSKFSDNVSRLGDSIFSNEVEWTYSGQSRPLFTLE